MASPDARIEGSDPKTTQLFELFSGGFSGWSHAMRRLQQLGFPFKHLEALDMDVDCAEMFCKSHGFEHVFCPERFDWGSDDLGHQKFVISHICEYRWCHLLSNFSMIWLRPVLHAHHGALQRRVQDFSNMKVD